MKLVPLLKFTKSKHYHLTEFMKLGPGGYVLPIEFFVKQIRDGTEKSRNKVVFIIGPSSTG